MLNKGFVLLYHRGIYNSSFNFFFRFLQAPHSCILVPAIRSITLAMGCAICSTRSPKPKDFGLRKEAICPLLNTRGFGLWFLIIINVFNWLGNRNLRMWAIRVR